MNAGTNIETDQATRTSSKLSAAMIINQAFIDNSDECTLPEIAKYLQSAIEKAIDDTQSRTQTRIKDVLLKARANNLVQLDTATIKAICDL